MKAIANQVFFLANDGVHGQQLWSSDGTQAGTGAATGFSNLRRGVLVLLWAAALACSGALIAPSIVATLRMQPLSEGRPLLREVDLAVPGGQEVMRLRKRRTCSDERRTPFCTATPCGLRSRV
jgi:hypothetical protein